MTRIYWLDMLRGYALVCIMLDHMPASVLHDYTLAHFALFDAAELFVLLSGFLVGLVWLQVSTRDGLRAAQKRFLRRSFQVWRAMVIGAVVMALISAVLWHFGLKHTAIWDQYARMVVESPLAYTAAVGAMWLQPNLMDVLALYVVLIATVPLTLPLLQRWPVWMAVGSVALWIMAVPLNALLPNHRSDGGFLFNPFGWQLLFFSGAAIGLYRKQMAQALRPHARWLTAASVVILLFGLIYDLAPKFGADGKALRDSMAALTGRIDKWSMDPARYISIMAATWMVATVLSAPLARLAETRGGRALAVIGRGGLWSFVVCVWLSVTGDAVQMLIPKTQWGLRMAIDLIVILALWAAASLWMNRANLPLHWPRWHRAG